MIFQEFTEHLLCFQWDVRLQRIEKYMELFLPTLDYNFLGQKGFQPLRQHSDLRTRLHGTDNTGRGSSEMQVLADTASLLLAPQRRLEHWSLSLLSHRSLAFPFPSAPGTAPVRANDQPACPRSVTRERLLKPRGSGCDSQDGARKS